MIPVSTHTMMDVLISENYDSWPIVHSSMKPNSNDNWCGTDNEKDFLINLKQLPQDWIYRTKSISYKFNNNGLRMDKELDQVDKSYMIAFGCSHTVGIGVALEDSWPYLLSKELNLDYINSAVSGSSIKLNCINFFNMLSTVETLPKIVAFAWPSSIRHVTYSEGQFLFYLPRYTSNDAKFKYHIRAYENMLLTDILTYDAIFYRNMVKTTCNRLGIKYCEISFDSRCEFSNLLKIDVAELLTDFNRLARDIRKKSDGSYFAHAGIGVHALAKNLLLKQL